MSKIRIELLRKFEKGVPELIQKGFSEPQANALLRASWNKPRSIEKDLPQIISQDGFLSHFAQGLPSSLPKQFSEKTTLNPLLIGKNGVSFFDVRTTPPGFFPKFLVSFRRKKDRKLLENIQSDLNEVAEIEDPEKRRWVTLAILSHGAAYRELDQITLQIPSFIDGKLTPYLFKEHFFWEGIKTVSGVPLKANEKAIYLAQGTEIWPSQPIVLSTLLANLGQDGVAVEVYNHSKKEIHGHLEALNKPIVAGHSMGGSLAALISIYAPSLIEEAFAFNPPGFSKETYEVYRQVPSKLFVFANIDDIPFWRMGEYIIGKVTILMGFQRWKYLPLYLKDVFLVVPFLYKMVVNVFHCIPTHQSIVALQSHYLSFTLTEEEIEIENRERKKRVNRILFYPFMYKILYSLIRFKKLFSRLVR